MKVVNIEPIMEAIKNMEPSENTELILQALMSAPAAVEWLPADHLPPNGDPVLAEGRLGGRLLAKYDHMDRCWIRATGLHEAKIKRWLSFPEDL